MNLNERKGWIFGPRADLVAFTFPIFLALALHFSFHWYFSFLGVMTFIMLVRLFIDLPHVYSTFAYVYSSKTHWERHRFFLIFIPVFIFATSFILQSYYPILITLIIGNWSCWHFIKQQCAWFHIASSKGSPRDAWTMRIDKAAILAATLGFVAIGQSRGESFGWITPGDLVEFPTYLHLPFITITALIIGAYFICHAVRYYKNRSLNISAMHLFIVTMITWGASELWFLIPFDTYPFGRLLRIAGHGFAYFVLSYYYTSMKYKSEDYVFPKINYKSLAVLGYLLLIVLAFCSIQFEQGFISNREVFKYIQSFYLSFVLGHFCIDMFIWNRKSNPGWEKALYQA